MSRFLDKLEQTMEAKSQPMGFAAAASRPRSRPMLVLARLPHPDPALAELALAEKVDGCLLARGQELEPALKVLGEMPWGVALEVAEDLGQLQEKGCDFLVVTLSAFVAPLLQEEDVGCLLEVDLSLPDNLARTIERLPVAALVLREGRPVGPLTLRQWMVLHRLSLLSGCPLFIPYLGAMAREELEALWEAGVRGLMIDLGEIGAQEIRELIDVLESLKAPTRKGRERKTASLPPIFSAEEEWEESD